MCVKILSATLPYVLSLKGTMGKLNDNFTAGLPVSVARIFHLVVSSHVLIACNRGRIIGSAGADRATGSDWGSPIDWRIAEC